LLEFSDKVLVKQPQNACFHDIEEENFHVACFPQNTEYEFKHQLKGQFWPKTMDYNYRLWKNKRGLSHLSSNFKKEEEKSN